MESYSSDIFSIKISRVERLTRQQKTRILRMHNLYQKATWRSRDRVMEGRFEANLFSTFEELWSWRMKQEG